MGKGAVGKIANPGPRTLASLMTQAGVIFNDGNESRFLQFNSGARAATSVAEKEGHLVV